MVHNCRFFHTDEMIDVTTRGNYRFIHCRRCGGRLSDDQVEKKTLAKINEKRDFNNKKKEFRK